MYCQQIDIAETTCHVSQILHQFLLLVQCCPEREFTEDFSPLHQSELSSLAIACSASDGLLEVKEKIQVWLVKGVDQLCFTCSAKYIDVLEMREKLQIKLVKEVDQ